MSDDITADILILRQEDRHWRANQSCSRLTAPFPLINPMTHVAIHSITLQNHQHWHNSGLSFETTFVVTNTRESCESCHQIQMCLSSFSSCSEHEGNSRNVNAEIRIKWFMYKNRFMGLVSWLSLLLCTSFSNTYTCKGINAFFLFTSTDTIIHQKKKKTLPSAQAKMCHSPKDSNIKERQRDLCNHTAVCHSHNLYLVLSCRKSLPAVETCTAVCHKCNRKFCWSKLFWHTARSPSFIFLMAMIKMSLTFLKAFFSSSLSYKAFSRTVSFTYYSAEQTFGSAETVWALFT